MTATIEISTILYENKISEMYLHYVLNHGWVMTFNSSRVLSPESTKYGYQNIRKEISILQEKR